METNICIFQENSKQTKNTQKISKHIFIRQKNAKMDSFKSDFEVFTSSLNPPNQNFYHKN